MGRNQFDWEEVPRGNVVCVCECECVMCDVCDVCNHPHHEPRGIRH